LWHLGSVPQNPYFARMVIDTLKAIKPVVELICLVGAVERVTQIPQCLKGLTRSWRKMINLVGLRGGTILQDRNQEFRSWTDSVSG
jgi:hypothetical protein